MKGRKPIIAVCALLSSLACLSFSGRPDTLMEEFQTEIAATQVRVAELSLTPIPADFIETNSLRVTGVDSQAVDGLALSADGGTLAVAGFGGDTGLVFFDTVRGPARLSPVVGEQLGLDNVITFSPDDTYVATRDVAGGLILIDVETTERLQDDDISLPDGAEITRFVFALTGDSIIGLTSQGALVELEMPSGDLIRETQIYAEGGGRSISLLPDGGVITAGLNANGEITVNTLSPDWDNLRTIDLPAVEIRVAPATGVIALYAPGAIYIAEDVTAFSANIPPDFEVCDQEGNAAFSPDGRFLAIVAPSCPVQVYDVASGELIFDTDDERGGHGVAFSPDGLRLYAGTNAMGVAVFDVVLDFAAVEGLPTPFVEERPTPLSFGSGPDPEAISFCEEIVPNDLLEDIFDQDIVERRSGNVNIGAETFSCGVEFTDRSRLTAEVQVYASALEASARFSQPSEDALNNGTFERIDDIGTESFFNTQDQRVYSYRGPYFIILSYAQTPAEPRLLLEELGQAILDTLPETNEDAIVVSEPSIVIDNPDTFCDGLATNEDYTVSFGLPVTARSASQIEDFGSVTVCLTEYEDGSRTEVLVRLFESPALNQTFFAEVVTDYIVESDIVPVANIGEEAFFAAAPFGYFAEAGGSLNFYQGSYYVEMGYFASQNGNTQVPLVDFARRVAPNLF